MIKDLNDGLKNLSPEDLAALEKELKKAVKKNTSKKKKIETRGGARKGAGNKKSLDPNRPVTIQVRESKIKAIGSIDQVKQVAYSAIDSAATGAG